MSKIKMVGLTSMALNHSNSS